MEIWKPIEKIAKFNSKLEIVNYNDLTNCGYEVSNFGNIRNKYNRALKGASMYGYRSVKLTTTDSDKVSIRIHQIVAQVFLGLKEHCSVDHIDGDRANNNLTNIRWATPKQQKINQGSYVEYLEKLLRKNNIEF